MYWPLGTPRVFIANIPRKKTSFEIEEAGSSREPQEDDTTLVGLRVSRNGQLFATITGTTLYIWQTSPVVVLTSVERSTPSLGSYGSNVRVLLRPDSSVVAVQTSLGFLVTYDVVIDPTSRVYQRQRQDEKLRRQSFGGRLPAQNLYSGQQEVHIRFRMIIKIEAGIGTAVALDDGLMIATEKPAAVQCIPWTADNKSTETSTELLSRIPWMSKKTNVVDIIHDRAMNLYVWVTGDGKVSAVQKIPGSSEKPDQPRRLFRGYGFHVPGENGRIARRAAINARFSLLAVGCESGEIHVYTARDYVGNIPLSYKLIAPASASTTGSITFMSYSPDGYCLFAGYERGWVMWSVYGKLGGSSFSADRAITKDNDDLWLMGFKDGSWIDGGSGMLFTTPNDSRLWLLEVVRSAVTGCFTPSNVSRMLLHSSSSLMVYRGHDISDIVSVSGDASLWHQAQFPATYLADQRPIRSAVISSDGRYIAIAGRRGLAHYSVHSGRWKTFDDPHIENSFVVRGGMCWHQHILIAAVDFGENHELRLYSRELGLNESSLIFVEVMSSPIVAISPTRDDSLLVYTYENNLFHYIIAASGTAVQLVQVGQIGLHGIVRAPARVRAVTWYIPDHQLLDGDPSQDVVHASVIFLVDAKLVMLQPSKDKEGTLKYDMRIIANDVEFFAFVQDQSLSHKSAEFNQPLSAIEEDSPDGIKQDIALQDSLWFFNGNRIQCWPDIQDLLKPNSLEGTRELPQPITVLTEFYPTSVGISNGVVIGIEPELVQRRDAQFAFFRFSIRTQLFLPPILHHYLSLSDSPSALAISHNYQHLPYFPHALEVLLHTVLDDEVDSPNEPALLPTILAFLAAFPSYLDILVQCTRKTELRSWRTLFKYLPPPQDLFEESLERGLLKTAGGYLLILHTFDELDQGSEQCIRLLQRAKEVGDWDLCKELARFLMALDESGDSLREAMRWIDVRTERRVGAVDGGEGGYGGGATGAGVYGSGGRGEVVEGLVGEKFGGSERGE